MKRKTLYHIEINGEVCNDILGMAGNTTVSRHKLRKIRKNIERFDWKYVIIDCFSWISCKYGKPSPYIVTSNEKEEPFKENHRYLYAETRGPVYYCNPEPGQNSCAKMLAAGKCKDQWMRENIGAILYPQHYLNQKTK